MSKAKRHIGDLREMLFRQMDQLLDPNVQVDLDRARVTNDTSRQIIDSAKVEVAYAVAIQGAMTMPFIEHQDGSEERPHQPQAPAIPAPAKPEPEAAPESRAQQVLDGGPPSNHPWRGLGDRVHRIAH